MACEYIYLGDNECSKAIVDNPSSVSRSKHVDVKLHSIQGLVRTEEVKNFARRNKRTPCRCLDVGSLEKEIPGTPRGVDEPFLTSWFRRVFCFHLISS